MPRTILFFFSSVLFCWLGQLLLFSSIISSMRWVQWYLLVSATLRFSASPPGMNPDQQTSGHVVWLHSIEFVYHEGFYVSKWSNRGAKVKLWNPVGNDKINATNRIGWVIKSNKPEFIRPIQPFLSCSFNFPFYCPSSSLTETFGNYQINRPGNAE